ncbi:MAG: DUF1820 family protein [Acidobacteriota bacterium]|nr:DUF1820 family protein [Acidobacteriota bacterium]
MANKSIYRVKFLQQGDLYEIYARQVSQGGLLGFVEVEEVLFGERSQLVVDPSEERLKTEFDGVERFYVPLHSVIRIDQVDRQGTPRVSEVEKGKENVAAFPMPLLTPKGSDK